MSSTTSLDVFPAHNFCSQDTTPVPESLPKSGTEHGARSPPDYEREPFLRPVTAEALNSRYRNDRMCVCSAWVSLKALTPRFRVDVVNVTIKAGVASLMYVAAAMMAHSKQF